MSGQSGSIPQKKVRRPKNVLLSVAPSENETNDSDRESSDSSPDSRVDVTTDDVPESEQDESFSAPTDDEIIPVKRTKIDPINQKEPVAQKKKGQKVLVSINKLLSKDESKLFSLIYHAEKNDVQEIATNFFVPEEESNIKRELVKFVMYSLQYPMKSRAECGWTLKCILEYTCRLNEAQCIGEKLHYEENPNLTEKVCLFFYHGVLASIRDPKTMAFLPFYVRLSTTLMHAGSQFIRCIGATITSGMANGFYAALRSYSDKYLLSQTDDEKSELKDLMNELIEKHCPKLESLLRDGLRDVYQPARLICLDSLVDIMKRYQTPLLNDRNLNHLFKMLCSNNIPNKECALKNITILVEDCYERRTSFKHMDSFLKKAEPFLFLCLKITSGSAYETAYRILFAIKRLGLMNNKRSELLEDTTFVHLMDPANAKIRNKAGIMFEELHRGTNLLVALSGTIVKYVGEFDDDAPNESCIATAVSALKPFLKAKAVKEAILELVQVKHRAFPMIVIIKEALKIMPTKAKTTVRPVVEEQMNTLFTMFKNKNDVLLDLAEICKVVGHGELAVVQLVKLAQTDCDADRILNLLLGFKNLKQSYEFCVWLQTLAEEMDAFTAYISSWDENTTADFSNYESVLKWVELIPTRLECKPLFLPCSGILGEIIDKILIFEDDEEILIQVCSIQANVLTRERLMSKTEELCQDNFPGMTFDVISGSMKEKCTEAIDCMQKILKQETISQRVKIWVLSYLFRVFNTSYGMGETGIDEKVICDSLEELIFHPSQETLLHFNDPHLRKTCLSFIVSSSNCFSIKFKISSCFITALGRVEKPLEEIAFAPLRKFLDDAKRFDEDKRYLPFKLILNVLFSDFDMYDDKDLCMGDLKKNAIALAKRLPHSDQFEKPFVQFCTRFLTVSVQEKTYERMLPVAKIFLNKLSQKQQDGLIEKIKPKIPGINLKTLLAKIPKNNAPLEDEESVESDGFHGVPSSTPTHNETSRKRKSPSPEY